MRRSARFPGLSALTLPIDASSTDSVAYYQVESGGALESMGFDSIDKTGQTISFYTRAPGTTGSVAAALTASPRAQVQRAGRADATSSLIATYVAIGVSQATLTRMAATQSVVDSGFRPSVNGFSLPNFGSSYRESSGGNCFGMVGFAKYYYQMAYASPLVDTYRDAQKSATWIDDAVGIELASREQNQMLDIWTTYVQELNVQTSSSSDVAYSLLGALYVTGKPALVAMWTVVGGETAAGHAVSVWSASVHADGSIAFATYDPNFPKDDARKITWSRAGGFDNYVSGDNSATADQTYNAFKQVGMALGLTPEQLARDKADADAGYPDTVFPKFTITAIRGQTTGEDALANTGTSPDGLTTFKTADTAVVIEGTVLGGNAQMAGSVANYLNVFGPDGRQSDIIDNDEGSGTGHFSVVVPVRPGLNPIALLASDDEVVTHWSAFKQVIVESDAAPSYFTSTLIWDRDTSDVDLYVKEPDGAAGSLYSDLHRRHRLLGPSRRCLDDPRLPRLRQHRGLRPGALHRQPRPDHAVFQRRVGAEPLRQLHAGRALLLVERRRRCGRQVDPLDRQVAAPQVVQQRLRRPREGRPVGERHADRRHRRRRCRPGGPGRLQRRRQRLVAEVAGALHRADHLVDRAALEHRHVAVITAAKGTP